MLRGLRGRLRWQLSGRLRGRTFEVLRVLVPAEEGLRHRLVRLVLDVAPMLLVLVATHANALLLARVAERRAEPSKTIDVCENGEGRAAGEPH